MLQFVSSLARLDLLVSRVTSADRGFFIRCQLFSLGNGCFRGWIFPIELNFAVNVEVEGPVTPAVASGQEMPEMASCIAQSVECVCAQVAR